MNTSTVGLFRGAFGIVSQLRAATGHLKARYPQFDDLESPWLAVLQSRAGVDQHYTLPDVGDQVFTLLDEHGDTGVVLGSPYSSVDRPPAGADQDVDVIQRKDGSSMRWNRKTREIILNVPGKVCVEAAAEVTVLSPRVKIEAAEKVTVTTPWMEVSGLLTVGNGLAVTQSAGASGAAARITGSVEIQQGDVKADSISLKQHVHGGVDPGSGASGPPRP